MGKIFRIRMAMIIVGAMCVLGCTTTATTVDTPETDAMLRVVSGVETQPLVAQAQRIVEALEYLGGAMQPEDVERLQVLSNAAPGDEVSNEVQVVLDKYCLAEVHINPEARVKVRRGPATAQLMQGGWRNFLIKVHNESGTSAALEWASPNAEPVLHASTGEPEPKEKNLITDGELANRFLEIYFYEKAPLTPELSGLGVEYKVLQLYTKETGKREAQLSFNVGQGSQDIGFRNALAVLFDCVPSVKVKLEVKDEDGGPTMASFIFRDNVERIPNEEGGDIADDYRLGKAQKEYWSRPGLDGSPLIGVYPLPSRRVALVDEYPDFFFQPQVYRADGEHIFLPPGKYDVTWTRGPEYLPQTRTIVVPEGVAEHQEKFTLARWIHMKNYGWYSADHHVHGGGCSHYESPEAGVQPHTMMRQALGEDLNVSCVLTWGPCWYHQKTFFEGAVHKLSTAENLMRYDVEVSGFPSSHAGHLCLLRLKEDDYPCTTKIEEWPSWTLPVLQWGQSQGGVVGYSHSGWGLQPMKDDWALPNYTMAKFDGIGANEYIVTATQGAVDFISAGDTPLTWELNIWYHVLNCGYRTAISGETDFPCIFDDRIGMARTYTKLGDRLDFDAMAEEIKKGTNYVSEGRAHIFDVSVNGAALGGEVKLATSGSVGVDAKVAAFLDPLQNPSGARIASEREMGRPYWHIEKSRVAGTRQVTVELVVNGQPVAQQNIEADGVVRPVHFDVAVDKSSWVALRILYSAHTNPVYVLLGDKPVRASRRSAEWCRDAVEQCWRMKRNAIRNEDRDAAKAAYDAAKEDYEKVVSESFDDRVKN